MEVKDMAEKKLAYLHSKSWAEVTREERFFCAELFSLIREDETRKPFFDLLGIEGKEKQDSFDVGFEVCFYRDVLWKYGERVKKTYFPQKRTFDLALMSDTDLYLIEAKAHECEKSKDLATIKRDKTRIKKLCKRLKVKLPEVHTIALVSSGYHDKLLEKGWFGKKVITWAEVADEYEKVKRTQEIERAIKAFRRADGIYKDSKSPPNKPGHDGG
ncbi:MAG: hypothetical protein MdMp014T_0295 [Treponematales bacterium]